MSEEYPYITPETIIQRRKLLWVFWDEPFESVLKRLAPRQYEELSESEKVRLMGKLLWDLFQKFDIPAEVRDRVDFLAHADPKLSLRENLETLAEHSGDPLIKETVKKIIADMERMSKKAEKEAEKGWEIIYQAEQPKSGEVIVEYLLQHPEELDRLRKMIKEDPEMALWEIWELVKPEIGIPRELEEKEETIKMLAQKELEAILEAIETAHLEQKHIENLKQKLNTCLKNLQEKIEKIKKEKAKEEIPKPSVLFRPTTIRIKKTLGEIAREKGKDIYDTFTEVITQKTRDPDIIRCVFLRLLPKGLDKATLEDIEKAYRMCREEY